MSTLTFIILILSSNCLVTFSDKSPAQSSLIPLPKAESLSGYFASFKDGDATIASNRAQFARNSQRGASQKASEYVSYTLANEAKLAAAEANAIVAVQHERAAQLSKAVQGAHSRAFTSSALASKLSKVAHNLQILEEHIQNHVKAIKNLASSAGHISDEALNVLKTLAHIEVDQSALAAEAQDKANYLSNKQTLALHSLSVAQGAANKAHEAASGASTYASSHGIGDLGHGSDQDGFGSLGGEIIQDGYGAPGGDIIQDDNQSPTYYVSSNGIQVELGFGSNEDSYGVPLGTIQTQEPIQVEQIQEYRALEWSPTKNNVTQPAEVIDSYGNPIEDVDHGYPKVPLNDSSTSVDPNSNFTIDPGYQKNRQSVKFSDSDSFQPMRSSQFFSKGSGTSKKGSFNPRTRPMRTQRRPKSWNFDD